MDLVLVGERIRQERERAGYNQRQLAERSMLSQPTLNRIELGTRARVTLVEIDRIASALDIPVRLLTSGNPLRDRVQIAARTNDLVPADRDAAIRHVLEVLELDARLDAAGLTSKRQRRRPVGVTIPDESLPMEKQAKELAAQVRADLGLGSAPISDIDELIERFTGVDTAVLKLPSSRDGFTATDPELNTTLIVVRTCNVPERQRFSFAHELGHLLWGDGAKVHQLEDRRSLGERRSDSFARHLLAPQEGVEAWLADEGARADSEVDERTAALLARYFRVSFQVALIQLSELGLITDAQKSKLLGPTGTDLAQRYGWGPAYEQEQESAEVIRPPRRILERAVEAYRQNLIGVKALAMLEGRKAEEARSALEEAGIVPSSPVTGRADLSRLIARGRKQRDAG
ncbi:helix-turn-helix domain-containing protein [Streptacidiphilus carbonis]|uniref:helix-turn-helix domain-containing protein n=1 Tax=Streptacidiphilus carbonis TaxID=105422 RepID=UPI0005AB2DB8|nr:XRE family transcriptional regulator [Streptacidiphilus carbonis]